MFSFLTGWLNRKSSSADSSTELILKAQSQLLRLRERFFELRRIVQDSHADVNLLKAFVKTHKNDEGKAKDFLKRLISEEKELKEKQQQLLAVADQLEQSELHFQALQKTAKDLSQRLDDASTMHAIAQARIKFAASNETLKDQVQASSDEASKATIRASLDVEPENDYELEARWQEFK